MTSPMLRSAWRTAAVAALFWATPVSALEEAEALGRAELAVREAESELGKIATLRLTTRSATPEERLAAGEVFLRQGDYKRAAAALNQVIELHRQQKATQSAHADALYLLAEAYFRDDQLLAARRQYRALAELAARPEYSPYAGRALGRLVDVALRTDRLEGLEFVFESIAKLPPDDALGSLPYATGKAHFARRDYAKALNALARVADDSEFAPQAGYLAGVIYTRQALEGTAAETNPEQLALVPALSRKFARAVLQFQKVTRFQAETSDEQHVVDLAWMALGRLFYETDNLLDAVDAYNHVGRPSPEFSTVLFELSWVYVRMGDYRRAEQALELLAIVSPETLSFAEGALLRADLMLRSNKFEEALEVYQSVKSRFDPVRGDLDAFLEKTTDPAVYYDRLIEDRIGIRTENQLPPVVMDWVREESEDQRVFALIDGVTRARELVRESRQMVRKMDAVLTSSTRAKAFPDLKLKLQHSLGVINQLALAKRTLALALDDLYGSKTSAELAEVRSERRALMERLRWLPVTPGDFARRETVGQNAWDEVSQRLQHLALETDKLQAIVNGLRRVLRDADRYGVARSPEGRARFQAEIEANERQIEVYHKRIAEYRDLIERGRIQIGFGDDRYVEDRQVRDKFERAFNREMELVAGGAAGADGVAFAQDAAALLTRASSVQARLTTLIETYEQQVGEEATRLAAEVSREAEQLQSYADQLDSMDQHARLLVGEVAMRNFGLVRERLSSIVLRADVGVVQQAWEVRESHRDRVRNLQRTRATEEQRLNDEMREVLHSGADEQ